MKLFLYTDSARLSNTDKRRLAKAGYVPVRVEDTNAIRIVEPLPEAANGQQLDIITTAAIEAIRTQSINYDARTAFGAALVKLLQNAALQRDEKGGGE